MNKFNFSYIKKILYNLSGMQITLIFVSVIFFCLYHDYIIGGYNYIEYGDQRDIYVPHLIHLINMIHDKQIYLWDFNLGIGTSFFANTAYYFDIFNLPLIFFNIFNIYTFLILALYLKVIICSIYMYKYLYIIGIRKKTTLVIFTIPWVFSCFFLLMGQHYFYATTFVYFTIIMYLLENVLHNKKYLKFSLIIGLTGILNLYLLISIAIYVVIYIISKNFIYTKRQFLYNVIKNCLLVGSLAFLGILIFAPLILPQISLLLSNPRKLDGFILSINSVEDMANIIGRFFSPLLNGFHTNYSPVADYWETPELGSSLFVIITFILSLRHNKNYKELIVKLFTLLMLFLLITTNFVGGLTVLFLKYETRLIYPLVFTLIIFGASFFEKNNIKDEFPNIIYILLMLSSYNIFFNILTGSTYSDENTKIILYSYLVVIIFIFIYLFIFKKNKKIIPFIVALEIIFVNYHVNHFSTNPYVSIDYLMIDMIEDIKINDKTEFYRINDERDVPGNANLSLTAGYNSINIYSSFVHPNYVNFARNLGYLYTPNSMNINVTNNSEKTKKNIFSFLGVKYFANSNTYNYTTNETAYSLGTLYNEIISDNEIENLDPRDKSELLLNYAIVGEENKNLINYDLENANKKITSNVDSTVIGSNNITLIDNIDYLEYTVNDIDPNIIYNIESNDDIRINIEIEAPFGGVMQIFFRDNDRGFSEDNSYRINIEQGLNTLNIPIESDFKIDYIRIDYGNIDENVKMKTNISAYDSELKNSYNDKVFMNITDFTDTNIFGDIKSDEDGILVFTIPYDNGWSVFANGEKLETFIVDYGMTGVYLNAGDYNIELKYNNLLFEIGCIVSIISLLGMTVVFIYYKKRT